MIIGELLPKNVNVPFETCNQEMTKKNISKMIDTVYRHCGQKDTVIFCDRIMGPSLLLSLSGMAIINLPSILLDQSGRSG